MWRSFEADSEASELDPFSPDDVIPFSPDDVIPLSPDDVIPLSPDDVSVTQRHCGAVDLSLGVFARRYSSDSHEHKPPCSPEDIPDYKSCHSSGSPVPKLHCGPAVDLRRHLPQTRGEPKKPPGNVVARTCRRRSVAKVADLVDGKHRGVA